MASRNRVVEVVIAEDASLSAATVTDPSLEYEGIVPVAVQMPATWTAANLTFQVSYDGGATYVNLTDEGTEYAVEAAASQGIALDANVFLGATHMKVRSGTVGTPVNQAAARTLSIVMLAVP